MSTSLDPAMISNPLAERFYLSSTSPSGLRYRKDAITKRGILLRAKDEAAGAKNPAGYWQVWSDERPMQAHRIVFELSHGRCPVSDIDHIDGNRSNNAIENLREVTPAMNARNCKLQSRNKTGKTGVDKFTANGYVYWRARWYTSEGRLTNKGFSIAKLGDQQAFDLACAYRDAMTAIVGGYTKRHGTSAM